MSAFLARHGAHIIVLGGPFVLLAGMVAMLELTRPGRPRTSSGPAGWLLGLAWAAAATTHLTVISEHFHEAFVLGIFFLLLSLAQYGYALAVILRPSTRLLLAGIAASTSVVVLWAYTRIVAVPFGLGSREPVGTADLVATTLEVVAIGLSGLLLHRSPGAQVGSCRGTARRPGRGHAAHEQGPGSWDPGPAPRARGGS